MDLPLISQDEQSQARFMIFLIKPLYVLYVRSQLIIMLLITQAKNFELGRILR